MSQALAHGFSQEAATSDPTDKLDEVNLKDVEHTPADTAYMDDRDDTQGQLSQTEMNNNGLSQVNQFGIERS
jgi:hypothetical protein